jgi:hypothetical protein
MSALADIDPIVWVGVGAAVLLIVSVRAVKKAARRLGWVLALIALAIAGYLYVAS